ncbi:MAG: hypothetical protein ACREP7_07060 [Lysobacter sp.]
MKGKLVTLLVLLSPMSAMAGQCEDSFSKEGNILTGAKYTASVTVPGLSQSSAIGQMRNIAIAKKMSILDESPENGSLLIGSDPNVINRGLELLVTATPESKVSIVMKTRQGQAGNAAGVKSEFCGMLNQLKPGKAAPTRATSSATEINAVKLADQIENQALDNVALIDARNKGKSYRVTGYYYRTETENGQINVYYDINPSLLPGFVRGKTKLAPTRIVCRMASDQRGYALTLSKGDKLDMTGTYAEYITNKRNFVIGGCRPNN